MEKLDDMDELLCQCPECRRVLIRYHGDKFPPKFQPSVVVFGNNVKKILCQGCIDKIQI